MASLILFNRLCLLCRLNSDTQTNLCSSCETALTRLSPETLCVCCGIPYPQATGTERCGQCLSQPPAFDRCVPVFQYQPVVAHLITQLKFHAQLAVEPWFRQALLTRLQATYAHEPLPDIVVPIPLHRRRLWQRGFNQAQLLAAPIAQALARPLNTTLLTKHRATPAQSSLSAKLRAANVRKTFHAAAHAWPHIALVDDVMTTGATVHEAAKALKKAGAKRVDVWCVARAGKFS